MVKQNVGKQLCRNLKVAWSYEFDLRRTQQGLKSKRNFMQMKTSSLFCVWFLHSFCSFFFLLSVAVVDEFYLYFSYFFFFVHRIVWRSKNRRCEELFCRLVLFIHFFLLQNVIVCRLKCKLYFMFVWRNFRKDVIFHAVHSALLSLPFDYCFCLCRWTSEQTSAHLSHPFDSVDSFILFTQFVCSFPNCWRKMTFFSLFISIPSIIFFNEDNSWAIFCHHFCCCCTLKNVCTKNDEEKKRENRDESARKVTALVANKTTLQTSDEQPKRIKGIFWRIVVLNLILFFSRSRHFSFCSTSLPSLYVIVDGDK